MRSQQIVGLCLSIVLTSVAAAAQQGGDTASPRSVSATTVTEETFPNGGPLPLRRVERRTESGGRKVFIETVAVLGIEGTWEPVEEVVTDTSRGQRDVFRYDLQRRRYLAGTTQSEETRANGRTRNVQRTWVADLDGRLTLSSGYVEETTSTSPGIRHTDATVLQLSTEGTLSGAERTESTEQQVSSAVVRHDSTYSVRDLNGHWLPAEARSGETRGVGSAERIREETIQRPNLNGALAVRDDVVTRTSETNGQNRVVIETYARDSEGFGRPDGREALSERVRRSTTIMADGGRSTVEEVEARKFLAPSDPM